MKKKPNCPKCGSEIYNLVELAWGGRFVICAACKYEGPRATNNADALWAYGGCSGGDEEENKTCGSCQWRHGDECRRFPPVPLCHIWDGTTDEDRLVISDQIRSEWPEIDYSYFCGEWKERKKIEKMALRTLLLDTDKEINYQQLVHYIAGVKAGIKLAKSHVHESEENRLSDLEWELEQEVVE